MDNKNALRERFMIAERMRTNNIGARVYNGSNRIQQHQYASERYTFYPEGVFVDPKTGIEKSFNGITVVQDLYRPNPEELTKWRKAKDKGEASDKDAKFVRKDQVATAGDIIAHIVSKNRENGLTELAVDDVYDKSGTLTRSKADEDERLMGVARDLFLVNRRKACTDIMNRYRARTSGMGQNDPERLYNSEEIEASNFLVEDATKKRGKSRFVCRLNCGFWDYNESRLAPHYAVMHKDVLAEESRIAEKKKPGRPRNQDKEATA